MGRRARVPSGAFARTATRRQPSRRDRGGLTALPALVGLVGLVVGSGLIAAVVVAGGRLATHVDAVAGRPGAASTIPPGIPVVERPARPAGAIPVVALAPSRPTRVEIPALGVSSGLEPLGLSGDGGVAAPSDFDVAGWFAEGPQPGQAGPAVISGHVDSREGPAVFYSLDELAIGDEVLVDREDGSVARFRVTDLQTYPKDQFPTDAVYGPVPGPELRLVTCDGPYDRSNHQYLDNLVVYAELAN